MESMDQVNTQAFFNDELWQKINSCRNTEFLSAVQGFDLCQMRNEHKSTLLHLAAEYNNKDLAFYLINLGANVNAQDNIGQTPLMLAIKQEREEIVEMLLKAKADLCIPNIFEHCALGIAVDDVEQISENIRQLVLHYTTSESLIKSPYFGTSIFHKDCPLYNYELVKNHELTRTLLQMGSPVNAQHHMTGNTAMHEAVDHLDLELVNLLLEYDAHINVKNHYDKRPLSFIDSSSTDEKTVNILKALLNAGAKIIINSSGKLMDSLLTQGSRQIVRAILECDFDLFQKNKRLERPIDFLLKNENPGVIEELINFKIDIGACVNDKTTLLHSAAKNGNVGLLKLLLRRGADVNAKNSENLMPLHVAIENFAAYVIEARELHESQIEEKEKAEERLIDRVKCIEILLKNGADPQIFTPDINYERHVASLDRSKNIEVNIQLLRPIFGQLAVHKASGGEINKFMLRQIRKRIWLQNILDTHMRKINTLKRTRINYAVNMFDFLVAKNVSVYANDEDFLTNLTAMMECFNDDSYYHQILREQFLRLTQLVAINNIFLEFFDRAVLKIAGKIVYYM